MADDKMLEDFIDKIEGDKRDKIFHQAFNALLGVLTAISSAGIIALWTQSQDSALQIVRLQEQVQVVKTNSERTVALGAVVAGLELRVSKLEREMDRFRDSR